MRVVCLLELIDQRSDKNFKINNALCTTFRHDAPIQKTKVYIKSFLNEKLNLALGKPHFLFLALFWHNQKDFQKGQTNFSRASFSDFKQDLFKERQFF